MRSRSLEFKEKHKKLSFLWWKLFLSLTARGKHQYQSFSSFFIKKFFFFLIPKNSKLDYSLGNNVGFACCTFSMIFFAWIANYWFDSLIRWFEFLKGLIKLPNCCVCVACRMMQWKLGMRRRCFVNEFALINWIYNCIGIATKLIPLTCRTIYALSTINYYTNL